MLTKGFSIVQFTFEFDNNSTWYDISTRSKRQYQERFSLNSFENHPSLRRSVAPKMVMPTNFISNRFQDFVNLKHGILLTKSTTPYWVSSRLTAPITTPKRASFTFISIVSIVVFRAPCQTLSFRRLTRKN